MATLTQFRPGEIWPDDHGVHINAHGGGILVHQGIFYWFGEHKVEGKLGNSAQVGVHVYSSRDLYNWRDEGIALRVEDSPDSDITRGCVLERPKVIYNARTSKFVMWFHLELKGRGYSASRSGVAISDHVTGPYQFIRSLRPNAGILPMNEASRSVDPLNEAESARMASKRWSEGRSDFPVDLIFRRDFPGGQMARDMTLFVDDDSTAYHVFASEENATLNIAELSEDYTTHTGRYFRVFPREFNEAPALFKHSGRYYMFSSDCTGWAPNPGRVAVADSIWGPWTHLGNPCRGEPEQTATTFESQSTHVLPIPGPVPGQLGKFIYMGDRWRPDNAIDGRYIWLPIEWENDAPVIRWHDHWDMRVLA
ncbi:MAG: family 43 glycosylhydrolase [Burkholderiales bacterium]|nr:family 43 glycosylhydrolase [Phycisphaerae bacterium]